MPNDTPASARTSIQRRETISFLLASTVGAALPASSSSAAPAKVARPTIFIIGASRGLGHAMAAEFVEKGWNVVGTVRSANTKLHDLAGQHEGRVEIEHVDVTEPDQIAALRGRLGRPQLRHAVPQRRHR